jgi:hypothetical protein
VPQLALEGALQREPQRGLLLAVQRLHAAREPVHGARRLEPLLGLQGALEHPQDGASAHQAPQPHHHRAAHPGRAQDGEAREARER